MEMPECRPLTAAAFCVLLFVATGSHAQECGDLDDSGEIAATDALLLLNKAVEQPVPDLICPLRVGLPATGQVTCYDEVGDEIDCAGTGQDGDLQRGAGPSFTDNGDGTITDNVTGLMWEKLSDDDSIHDYSHTYSWTEAFASKIATLNATSFAGRGDWRVPNIVELASLRNLGAFNPATYSAFNTGCVPGCTILTCSCTAVRVYWSSTTGWVNTDYAKGVYFYAGAENSLRKSLSMPVRAVRGGL